jgi:hypothetical protein
MDKDLATASMLERCACYDRSLAAARRVLEKYPVDAEEADMARRIIRSLGDVFLKQRFVDKALECYRLLVKYAPGPTECPADCGTDGAVSSMTDFGPNTQSVTTRVSQDVLDVLKALESSQCAEGKNLEQLLREGIYLLILRYSTEKEVRDLIFNKLKSVIRKTG